MNFGMPFGVKYSKTYVTTHSSINGIGRVGGGGQGIAAISDTDTAHALRADAETWQKITIGGVGRKRGHASSDQGRLFLG